MSSFTSYLLDECDDDSMARRTYEEDVKDVSGIIFSGKRFQLYDWLSSLKDGIIKLALKL